MENKLGRLKIGDWKLQRKQAQEAENLNGQESENGRWSQRLKMGGWELERLDGGSRRLSR